MVRGFFQFSIRGFYYREGEAAVKRLEISGLWTMGVCKKAAGRMTLPPYGTAARRNCVIYFEILFGARDEDGSALPRGGAASLSVPSTLPCAPAALLSVRANINS